MAFDIGSVLALASVLGSVFGRGGSDDKQKTGEGASAEQRAIFNKLFPQLQAGVQIDQAQSLRNAFLTDPQLASALSSDRLETLGFDSSDIQALTAGSVPLRSAANNLAFGLLPNFAKAQDPQRALFDASPLERVGREGTLVPRHDFVPLPEVGLPGPEPGFAGDNPTIGNPNPGPPVATGPPAPTGHPANDCMLAGGTPIYGPGGEFIRCDLSSPPPLAPPPTDDPTDDPDVSGTEGGTSPLLEHLRQAKTLDQDDFMTRACEASGGTPVLDEAGQFVRCDFGGQ